MKLYGYFRSSASFRVRIALNHKGIPYEQESVHLVKNEQKSEAYLAKNPQGLVPSLEDGDLMLTQSLAIVEYLDEKYPTPALLPSDAEGRARVRGMTQIIACEMQPLNNLRILRYLKGKMEFSEEQADEWYRHWLVSGFTALEAWVEQFGGDGGYCFGDSVSMVDVALIPQIYNSRRSGYDMSAHPRLSDIEQRLYALQAFDAAKPEIQPDWE